MLAHPLLGFLEQDGRGPQVSGSSTLHASVFFFFFSCEVQTRQVAFSNWIGSLETLQQYLQTPGAYLVSPQQLLFAAKCSAYHQD